MTFESGTENAENFFGWVGGFEVCAFFPARICDFRFATYDSRQGRNTTSAREKYIDGVEPLDIERRAIGRIGMQALAVQMSDAVITGANRRYIRDGSGNLVCLRLFS